MQPRIRCERTLDWVCEGRMKVVNHFSEAGSGLLISSFVKKVNLNVPALHWKAFYIRGLVTTPGNQQ